MLRRYIPALCLLATLAGCDDTGVSQINRKSLMNLQDLLKAHPGGSIFVEVHGAPWLGAKPEEIAGTLRMPEGKGRHLRFSAVPPGDPLLKGEGRLVLQFNPTQGYSSADCRATGPVKTAEPPSSDFSVSAIYCFGEDWHIRARLKTDVAAEDWLAYYQWMEKLLGAMFPPQ